MGLLKNGAKNFNYGALKIESGVEIPKPRTGPKSPRSKLFNVIKSMKVGDSIVVDTKHQYQYVRKIATSMDVKVTMREQEDGTIRIWKVRK